MESWQIFSYAKKVLPVNTVRLIFTRSSKCLECWGGVARDSIDSRWAADPTYCSATERNPIDRVKALITELDRSGYGNVARAAVDIIAEPLGGCFEITKHVHGEKGVAGEAADTMESLGDLIHKIRGSLSDGKLDKAEKADILDMVRKVKLEIDQLHDAAMDAAQ